jgi:hypothetical protein
VLIAQGELFLVTICVVVLKHAYILSTDRAHVGFATLRGYVAQRPLMRTDALNVLLELTTHPGSFSFHLFIGCCMTSHRQTNKIGSYQYCKNLGTPFTAHGQDCP